MATSGEWEPNRPWLDAPWQLEIAIWPHPQGGCQAWCNKSLEDGITYWEGWHSPKVADEWWRTPPDAWTLIGYHEALPDGTIGREFWAAPDGYWNYTTHGEMCKYGHAILSPEGSAACMKGRPQFWAKDKGKGIGKGMSTQHKAEPKAKPKGVLNAQSKASRAVRPKLTMLEAEPADSMVLNEPGCSSHA